MAASATFALKVGVWFRRGRLFMVSPDSLGTACPLSGRNSTYRPVQIFETSSLPISTAAWRSSCHLWISLLRRLVSHRQFYIGKYYCIKWDEGRHSPPSDIYADTAGEQWRSAT